MVVFILFFGTVQCYKCMLTLYTDQSADSKKKISHMNWLKYCTIRGDWETSKLNKSKFMYKIIK